MQLKEIIYNYMEKLWNQKNLSAIDEIFTDETLIHSPIKTTQGKEALKEIVQEWLIAFPDLHCQWEDWISEENKILVRWKAEGTHRNPFLDFPPTNKKVSYTGVSIYRLENDKVVEYWGVVDMHGLIKQIQAP